MTDRDDRDKAAPPPAPDVPPGTPSPAAGAARPAEAAKPGAGAAKAAPPPLPPDPAPPADMPAPGFITALREALPGAVVQVSYWVGDWTIIVAPGRHVEAGRFLRDHPDARFDYCRDVTAVDWPARAERFDVVYILYSTRLCQRVRMKVRVKDGDPVESVTGLWASANWLEREVFDLFGIRFEGHPDLRRILMPDEWQGHPLRKDYPLEGPGEMLLEDPQEWLKLRQAEDESGIA